MEVDFRTPFAQAIQLKPLQTYEGCEDVVPFQATLSSKNEIPSNRMIVVKIYRNAKIIAEDESSYCSHQSPSRSPQLPSGTILS